MSEPTQRYGWDTSTGMRIPERPTPGEDKPLATEDVVERVARAMFPQFGQEGWRHYDEYWLGKARAAIEAYEQAALSGSPEG